MTVFPLGRRLHPRYIDRPKLNEQICNLSERSPATERGPPKTCLIYGIGGSGKSQECIKYFDSANQ